MLISSIILSLKRLALSLGARPLVERVRAYQVLRAAEILLSERKVSSEDVLFAQRKSLRDMVERLNTRLARSSVRRLELMQSLSGVYEALGRKDDAIACWEALLDDDLASPDVCRIELARLELSRGKRLRAAELLDSVSGPLQDSDYYGRLYARVKERQRQPSREQIKKMALKGRRMLRDGKRAHFIRQTLEVMEWVFGQKLDVAPLEPVLDALFQFVHQEAVPVDDRRLVESLEEPGGESSRLVFCAGFAWSGSGAVFDYLNQHEAFDDILGRRELSLIESPEFGAERLLAAMEKEQPQRRAAVRDMVWAGVLGLPFRFKGKRPVEPRHCLLSCWRDDSELGRRLIEETTRFLREFTALEAKQVGAEVLEARLSEYLRCLFRPRGHHQLTLMNNVIHGQRLALLKLFPGSVGIAVMRDPRDQFVSRAFESGRRANDPPEQFIKYQHKIMQQFLDLASRKPAGYELAVVRFEEFVGSEETRRAVLSLTGADDTTRKPKDHVVASFDPDKSAGNVGVHVHYPEPVVLKRIQKELDAYSRRLPRWLLIR